jgi:chorismate mutase
MTTNQTAAAELPTSPEATPHSAQEPSAGAGEPTAPSAGTNAATDAATGGVTNGRARIDALDEQIADLIVRRGDVSREIQAARIADGGRRVDLRRETEIITRYTAALGRPGTAIAMALLELGRGRA